MWAYLNKNCLAKGFSSLKGWLRWMLIGRQKIGQKGLCKAKTKIPFKIIWKESVSEPVPKFMPVWAHTMCSNFNDATLRWNLEGISVWSKLPWVFKCLKFWHRLKASLVIENETNNRMLVEDQRHTQKQKQTNNKI